MKQQQLTFEKGMTNVPSDLLCSDNALEDSVGLIYRDGEHHVIQKPKETALTPYSELVFVHHVSDGSKVHIYNGLQAESQWQLYAESSSNTIPNSGHPSSSTVKVSAIGNTLIVLFDDEVRYFLWSSGTSYTMLELPEPQVTFTMKNVGGNEPTLVENTGRIGDGWMSNGVLQPEHHDDYNNLIVGLYAKNKKAHAKGGRFVNPFMVRVALELYDGSYTRISQPIMLFPCVTMNSYGAGSWVEYWNYVHLITQGYYLWYTLDSGMSLYSDIVKGIAVFVSDEVDVYETDSDQPWASYGTSDTVLDHILNGTYASENPPSGVTCMNVLKKRSTTNIADELATQSIFYKIATINLERTQDDQSVITTFPLKIESHALENLATQERLQYDDYYSHCALRANFLYSYNTRLHLSGLKRSFFKGFDYFLTYNGTTSASYTFYVTIKTDTGSVVVSCTKNNTLNQQGIYFYYPDPRATHVVIMKGNDCVCNAKLTEHPGLNGAYYFKGLPGIVGETTGTGTAPQVTTNPYEPLPSTLAVSEVNNPFVFRAAGYVKVGDGEIIAMSSQTQALSQGQFGQYPLVVFTTEGIWALSMNDVGEYVASRPFSREVALSSHPAITQTDGAIYFVSKKGLMVVAGSVVKCVSEQLMGKWNNGSLSPGTLFSNCFIAYDYRDSLLWIFSGSGSTSALVFSMKSGAFGRMTLGFTPARVVSDYPDYLIQANASGSNKVYTLYGRDDINTEAGAVTPVTYGCSLKSRPMKLENGLALKRIIQIMHIKDLVSSETNPLTFAMYGSNDLQHWYQLTSVRGVPWKYYRFEYTFTNVKATSTFSGTVITTEEVRTDRLR